MKTGDVSKVSSSSKYRDLNDPAKDLKDERNAKIAYLVAGTIVVLGAVLLIYLTAADKIGHFTSTGQKYVSGHYEGWNWISSHYEPVTNSLIGFNYTLYGFAAAGGVILGGVGISYDKEKKLHPWAPENLGLTPEALANAVKTDSLADAHTRLYKRTNERVVNLGECVRRGHLTEAQVTAMDGVLRDFQAEVVKERRVQGEQAVISRKYGGKPVSELVSNPQCTDQLSLQSLAKELVAIEAAKNALGSKWDAAKSDVFARADVAASPADNDEL